MLIRTFGFFFVCCRRYCCFGWWQGVCVCVCVFFALQILFSVYFMCVPKCNSTFILSKSREKIAHTKNHAQGYCVYMRKERSSYFEHNRKSNGREKEGARARAHVTNRHTNGWSTDIQHEKLLWKRKLKKNARAIPKPIHNRQLNCEQTDEKWRRRKQ